MRTITFSEGHKRYEARIRYNFKDNVLGVAIHRATDGEWLLDLFGKPKTTWQRLLEATDFIPLGVVRRAIAIFDEEMAQWRAEFAKRTPRLRKQGRRPQ